MYVYVDMSETRQLGNAAVLQSTRFPPPPKYHSNPASPYFNSCQVQQAASSELIVIGITDWRLLCPHSVVDSLDPILLSPVRPTYWRFGGPHRRGRSALRPRQQIDRHLARIAQFGRLVAPGSRPSAAHQKLVNTIFFFLSFRDPARDPLADFQWARAVWQPEEARYFYIFHL